MDKAKQLFFIPDEPIDYTVQSTLPVDGTEAETAEEEKGVTGAVSDISMLEPMLSALKEVSEGGGVLTPNDIYAEDARLLQEGQLDNPPDIRRIQDFLESFPVSMGLSEKSLALIGILKAVRLDGSMLLADAEYRLALLRAYSELDRSRSNELVSSYREEIEHWQSRIKAAEQAIEVELARCESQADVCARECSLIQELMAYVSVEGKK